MDPSLGFHGSCYSERRRPPPALHPVSQRWARSPIHGTFPKYSRLHKYVQLLERSRDGWLPDCWHCEKMAAIAIMYQDVTFGCSICFTINLLVQNVFILYAGLLCCLWFVLDSLTLDHKAHAGQYFTWPVWLGSIIWNIALSGSLGRQPSFAHLRDHRYTHL